MENIFKDLVKNKRFIYLVSASLLIIFALAVNMAFAAFSHRDVKEGANITVGNLKYDILANNNEDSVVKLLANKEMTANIRITSTNTIATKYELYYKLYSDEDCTNLIELSDNVVVEYPKANNVPLTGIIKVNESINMDLLLVNELSTDVYVKFFVNAGFTENTLALIDNIVNARERVFDKILADNNTNKAQIVGAGFPNFGEITSAEGSGLYAMEDEYNMSYYFHGEKANLKNNLIFGGYQWKIVRVNGDGSLRLIYNGVCPDNSCEINEIGEATQINGTFAYNTKNNDNKYLGYMYGGLINEASTSRNDAVTNSTNSNVKSILDEWYLNNLLGKEAEKYLVDNLFCNDRALSYDNPGDAFGKSETNYASYYRLETLKTPTLKCSQLNDRFTSSDNLIGNGNLSYPIGLITADELALGGLISNIENDTNYLYTNVSYWTMTPAKYGSNAQLWSITSDGKLTINVDASTVAGIRPVINIKSYTPVASGDGSIETPYIAG